MLRNDLAKLQSKLPLSKSTLARNQDRLAGLPATEPQSTEGNALECRLPGEAEGGTGPLQCFRITFTIFAQRPCDWDGYDVKALQDMLIKAAIIFADDWCFLQGQVISKKAHSKEQERTEIMIEPI